MRRALRLVESLDQAGAVPRPRPVIASPWTDRSSLETIVWADLFGVNALPPTRAEALSVPAMHRAVAVVTTSIARHPLTVTRAGQVVDPVPTWCYRTDGLSSPFHRMLGTVDDLIFYGESLWALERGADGYPLMAERVPYDRWSVDEDRTILIDNEPAADRSVVYIPGPHEGILAYGGRAIRAAVAVERAALEAAEQPFRLELHQTTDAILTDTEILELIGMARSALAEHGGVLFTNASIQAIVHPAAAEQLLVEGRNAASVDLARLAGLPASMIDATTAGASLTYETTEGRSQEYVTWGRSGFMAAIASRLSMADVLPNGQSAVFDLDAYIGVTEPAPPEEIQPTTPEEAPPPATPPPPPVEET